VSCCSAPERGPKLIFNFYSIGPFFLSLAFLPLLEASKQAPYGDKFQPQIINTSSMNGWTKDPITSGRCWGYLASKAAIASLTPQLAHDFLPIGVRGEWSTTAAEGAVC